MNFKERYFELEKKHRDYVTINKDIEEFRKSFLFKIYLRLRGKNKDFDRIKEYEQARRTFS